MISQLIDLIRDPKMNELNDSVILSTKIAKYSVVPATQM